MLLSSVLRVGASLVSSRAVSNYQPTNSAIYVCALPIKEECCRSVRDHAVSYVIVAPSIFERKGVKSRLASFKRASCCFETSGKTPIAMYSRSQQAIFPRDRISLTFPDTPYPSTNTKKNQQEKQSSHAMQLPDLPLPTST